jgi:hypothetical protein
MKIKSFKIVKICLMVKIKILARKFVSSNFILQPLFQSAQHLYEKRKISGSGSVLVTNGSGGSTTYESGSELCFQLIFLREKPVMCFSW